MSDIADRAKAGVIAGGSLAAALVAVSYVGWRLLAVPFAPFDLSDWLSRELPGWLVTLWIDSAVLVLHWVHAGSTATAAKFAEQTLAIAAFMTEGAVLGAATFVAVSLSDEPAVLLGAVLGGALGVGTTVIESGLRRLDGVWLLDTGWIVGTFFSWGLAIGYVHDHWRGAERGSDVVGGPQRIARRRFLSRVAQVTLASAALAAIYAAARRARSAIGARWSDTHSLPNADAPVQPVVGTRAEFTPLERHYRIDINTRTPVVDAATWRLEIGGMVDQSVAYTLNDLKSEEALDQFVTLSCISNPLAGDLIGTTRWTGVSIKRLLTYVGPDRHATHLRVRSADGFFEMVPLDIVRADLRVMLAYAWDGLPLLPEHGFPLRIYIPDVYGMKQPKWIESIEAVNHWEPGYWVERGWDKDGRMAATSVIDAVNGSSVGGIAHAGSRGISRVEVRVDDKPWTNAQLRDPLSQTTWVVWRAELHVNRGAHTISVRCYDGAEQLQSPPFHTVRTNVGA